MRVKAVKATSFEMSKHPDLPTHMKLFGWCERVEYFHSIGWGYPERILPPDKKE